MGKRLLCIVSLFLIVTFQSLPAYDASPKYFKEIQTDFFREPTVTTALSFQSHRIYRSQWYRISKDLMAANRRIPRLMKEEARRLDENPLEKPFQYEGAEKLLHSVTWSLFVEVMDRHYVKDQFTLQCVFTYIFEQESERIRTYLNLE